MRQRPVLDIGLRAGYVIHDAEMRKFSYRSEKSVFIREVAVERRRTHANTFCDLSNRYVVAANAFDELSSGDDGAITEITVMVGGHRLIHASAPLAALSCARSIRLSRGAPKST